MRERAREVLLVPSVRDERQLFALVGAESSVTTSSQRIRLLYKREREEGHGLGRDELPDASIQKLLHPFARLDATRPELDSGWKMRLNELRSRLMRGDRGRRRKEVDLVEKDEGLCRIDELRELSKLGGRVGPRVRERWKREDQEIEVRALDPEEEKVHQRRHEARKAKKTHSERARSTPICST